MRLAAVFLYQQQKLCNQQLVPVHRHRDGELREQRFFKAVSIWQATLSMSISLSTVISLELAEENIGKICATESK